MDAFRSVEAIADATSLVSSEVLTVSSHRWIYRSRHEFDLSKALGATKCLIPQAQPILH